MTRRHFWVERAVIDRGTTDLAEDQNVFAVYENLGGRPCYGQPSERFASVGQPRIVQTARYSGNGIGSVYLGSRPPPVKPNLVYPDKIYFQGNLYTAHGQEGQRLVYLRYSGPRPPSKIYGVPFDFGSSKSATLISTLQYLFMASNNSDTYLQVI